MQYIEPNKAVLIPKFRTWLKARIRIFLGQKIWESRRKIGREFLFLLRFNRKRQGILLNTLPKSGSLYLWDYLSRKLGMPQIYVSSSYFPDDIINSGQMGLLAKAVAITQEHLPARQLNLVFISRYLDRLVVHVRDPRQATLSWTHHVAKLKKDGNEEVLLWTEPLHPENYFSLSLTEQIDWQIENHLPNLIKWIEGWVDADDDPSFHPKILFTQYEDFKENPDAFFASIWAFYDLDKSFTYKEKTLREGDRHFRKGMVDEWCQVFSPEQAVKASRMIPERLLKKFKWSP